MDGIHLQHNRTDTSQVTLGYAAPCIHSWHERYLSSANGTTYINKKGCNGTQRKCHFQYQFICPEAEKNSIAVPTL